MDIAATVNWPALLGTTSSWAHLLDPLDLNLRRLILRCGDMCQVTYDSFINDKNSKYCGCSRYSKSTLLHKTCFPLADEYDVSGFLYATARVSVPESILLKSRSREAWDRESNWIGYIAVSNDSVSEKLGRREVYVAWRGTTRDYEWVDILGAKLASVKRLMKGGDDEGDEDDDVDEDEDEDEEDKEEVMLGWLTMYVSDDPKSEFTKVSARKQLLKKIGKLIEEHKHEKLSVIFTGHSLGASLSVISAFDVVENLTSEIPVSAFVFGCPKVGNKQFNDRLNSHHNLKILHIRNIIDVIPHYPVRVLGYVNTGIELHIDTRKSPYLKDSKNPSDWHNLQTMLHVVNGWNGSNGEFKVRIKRSLALVNKSCDMLKEECLVPASWWVEKNKGMVLNGDGEWVMGELDEENRPSPED